MADNPLNITITDAARVRMEQVGCGGALRLDIKTTGCSGNSYVMNRVDAALSTDDVITVGEAQMVIDKAKSWMLIGMTIDFQETDFVQEFVFTNPNEKGRCGCGESFAL